MYQEAPECIQHDDYHEVIKVGASYLIEIKIDGIVDRSTTFQRCARKLLFLPNRFPAMRKMLGHPFRTGTA
jgi:hypothetical protein